MDVRYRAMDGPRVIDERDDSLQNADQPHDERCRMVENGHRHGGRRRSAQQNDVGYSCFISLGGWDTKDDDVAREKGAGLWSSQVHPFPLRAMSCNDVHRRQRLL